MVKVETLSKTYTNASTDKSLVFKINVFIFLGSFFLARAVFFEAAVPFLISLYAVISMRYPQLKKATLIGGIIGAFSMGIGQVAIAFLQLVAFQLTKRWERIPLPIRVLGAVFFVQLMWQLFMYQGIPPAIVQFYVISEAILAMVMTVFLAYVCIPTTRIFLVKWTAERAAATFLVIAVLFTGMSNSTIYFFNLALIGFMLLTCLMASVGGVSLATLAATILGVVIGVSQLEFSGMIALYAMTGVIAGSFKVLGKVGVGIGAIIPSMIFFYYDATLPLDIVYFASVGFAIVVFLCVPMRRIEQIQSFVSPNREQILLDRQKWLTAHMTETMQQFQRFVLFIKDVTFERFAQEKEREKAIEPFAVCEGCFRYERCWQGQKEMIQPLEDFYEADATHRHTIQAEELIRLKCVKPDRLLEQLRLRLYVEQMQHQMHHGRKMIATQLQYMAEHVYHLLEQLSEQAPHFQESEQQLLRYLQNASIPSFQVDIFLNEAGTRQIYICCTGSKEQLHVVIEQVLLPVVYEFFAEPFRIEQMEQKQQPFPYVEMKLTPALRFELLHKVYSEKKGHVSGDVHAIFPVKEQYVALVLSDGVGYDWRAQQQSKKLVSLLQDCLAYMQPEAAMHTIHYVLQLEQQEDLYATLDFALVDLQKGTLWSWKAGGVATYIIRGKQVFKIEGKSPPVGFMPSLNMETMVTALQHGDLVFMVSDGLFEGPEGFIVREKAFLKLLKQQNRQKLAIDVLLYDVVAQFKQTFVVDDDCTILGCKMQHIQPEWTVLNVR